MIGQPSIEWISEKRSGLDIYGSNLICVNLADFTSWQDNATFEIMKINLVDQASPLFHSIYPTT